jgi:hypothetical protein
LAQAGLGRPQTLCRERQIFPHHQVRAHNDQFSILIYIGIAAKGICNAMSFREEIKMKCLTKWYSAVALVLITSFAFAVDFPTAPPKMKDVEAQGLPRLNAEELGSLLHGVIDCKGCTGQSTLTYKPDGSVDRKGLAGKDVSGKWRIDDKNNTYCLDIKQGRNLQEHCFAVFRAPDGTHYFDYDVGDGFFAHVWRQSSEQ